MPPRRRGGEVGQKENSCIRSVRREETSPEMVFWKLLYADVEEREDSVRW